ncbi:MAG TPA: metallophosphoesterase [Nitrososphaeraceae archaeon]|nr:metallophosphoesterase [Nitrososphaeraceae archaeon]
MSGFLLHPLTSVTQSSFAQNNQGIVISVANSSFVPLTNTDANQLRVNVEYTLEDEAIENELINAVMKVYALNGSLIRTTSLANGFTAQSDGVEELKTTFQDKSMQSVSAKIAFTDSTKKTSLSNVITVNLDLEEAPTSPSPFSRNTPLADPSQPIQAIEDFNFAAVGDFGCTSNTDDTVDNIVHKNPELVLALGDYSYESTGTCWFYKSTPIDNITRISIGNHEETDAEGFQEYMSHYGLSQTYYSFNHKNAHILVLDEDRSSYLPGSPQYDYAINDLQSASQDPDIDWIIVYFHRPIYTSPSSSSPSTSFRDPYHPLFDKYGVDLVLTGHNHNYQRTFPLSYNPSEPSEPIVTSTNANDYKNPRGAIFALVGTGGVGLSAILGKEPYVVVQQDDYYGQLDIKITDNGNKLEGKFYRNGDNAILDSFSIIK